MIPESEEGKQSVVIDETTYKVYSYSHTPAFTVHQTVVDPRRKV
jgi:hypothetical protein